MSFGIAVRALFGAWRAGLKTRPTRAEIAVTTGLRHLDGLVATAKDTGGAVCRRQIATALPTLLEREAISMTNGSNFPAGGRFDLHAVASDFPQTSETMLLDTYLTDSPIRSIRLFKVYQAVPAHYHTGCDEILYVLSGGGTFWIDDPMTEAAFAPGQLLVFPRRAVHALPALTDASTVFLAIDTPRRVQDDVTFIDTTNDTRPIFTAGI
ncbi:MULTISPECIES: cupin domain-containing protein [unclassified Asaia]|uniref:cupin domain-containing protein n=1 Tax=unclassified Asaia TaxID=2685023 RepID=UPI001F25C0A2|nr:cupin domain-containing protein [Asaia sp. W19]